MHKLRTQISVAQHKELKWVRLVKGLQHVECARLNTKKLWYHDSCSNGCELGLGMLDYLGRKTKILLTTCIPMVRRRAPGP